MLIDPELLICWIIGLGSISTTGLKACAFVSEACFWASSLANAAFQSKDTESSTACFSSGLIFGSSSLLRLSLVSY